MSSPDRAEAVFILTDFGTTDEFAGVMKAVIAREAAGAMIVDLTHEIPSFDIRQGALALERAAPHLGPGVVVAVVDPGVGTKRRGIAVAVKPGPGPRHLVGPDNGVLSFAIDSLGGPTAAVELLPPSRPPGAGATFDGRDLFAPAAARLWSGSQLHELGPSVEVSGLVHLDTPVLEVGAGELRAEVLWIDRFGNVQLSARASDSEVAGLGEVVVVEAQGSSTRITARRASSFAVGPGVGLIADSNGRLALVCEGRPAATVLGVQPGQILKLYGAKPSGEAPSEDRPFSHGAAC